MSEKVPEGWKIERLGDSLTLLPKSKLPSGVSDAEGYYNFYVCSAEIQRSFHCQVTGQSVLFSTGGEAAVHCASGKYSYSADVWATNFKGGLCNEYAYRFLFQNLEKINYLGFQGSGIKHLDKEFIKKIKIPIPPLPEQKKIASILTSVDEVIENTQKQIDKLQDLKKAAMNELLTKGIGHTEFKDSELGKIPKSWKVRNLGQCLISKPQYGAGASAIKWDDRLVRYIRITDIKDDGKLDEIAKAGILPELADGYLLEPDNVLIARTGNTVGKSYLHYETNCKFAFAGYLVRFKTNKSILLPNFFFQYTLSEIYQKWIKGMSRVGAQPNINATEYSEMPLPVPDTAEQKEINNILWSFDGQVESLRARLSKTQSLKKSLMQDLLTGKVRVKVN